MACHTAKGGKPFAGGLAMETLNAQYKKHAFDLPASLNKYQHEAFKAWI